MKDRLFSSSFLPLTLSISILSSILSFVSFFVGFTVDPLTRTVITTGVAEQPAGYNNSAVTTSAANATSNIASTNTNAARANTSDNTDKSNQKTKEKLIEEKVITGVIASQGTFKPFAGVSVDTNGTAPGEEQGVITASIAPLKGDDCSVVFKNSGTKDYSIYFLVKGVDRKGAKRLNYSGTAVVKSKQELVRIINSCSRELNLAVELRSAKPLK